MIRRLVVAAGLAAALAGIGAHAASADVPQVSTREGACVWIRKPIDFGTCLDNPLPSVADAVGQATP